MATYLRLGRVSNLPTVWTNTLCGVVLASSGGGVLGFGVLKTALLASIMSLFYVAGMFLNDAFDRDIDAKERPDRPIPAGHVAAREVFTLGFGMIGAAEILLFLQAGYLAALAGAALAGNIVLYDMWHKKNPLSPFLMGGCRVMVYVTSAIAAGALNWAVLAGAAALFCYLIGLTYVAKHEGKSAPLWPLVLLAVPFVKESDAVARGFVGPVIYFAFVTLVGWCVTMIWSKKNVGQAIVALICGISLLDGLLLAGAGHTFAAACAGGGFFATRAMQRWVRGT